MSSTYNRAANRMVTCPYDESHRCKESRLQMHIAKCKLNHLDTDMKTCPFNAQHRLNPGAFQYHLMNCPDRAVLDRKLAASVDKNNIFKGRTAVPCYSQDLPVTNGECWDDDISPVAAPGYTPRNMPPGDGIAEPSAMSKPAERRKFYKDLHKIHNEPENSQPEEVAVRRIDPNAFERQPKQPSEAQLYLTSQRKAEQNFQNLGLGRGMSVSNTRIAADIFGQRQPSVMSQPPSYSEITHGLGQLGLGRGWQRSESMPFYNDADFPALGIGRGAQRIGKIAASKAENQ